MYHSFLQLISTYLHITSVLITKQAAVHCFTTLLATSVKVITKKLTEFRRNDSFNFFITHFLFYLTGHSGFSLSLGNHCQIFPFFRTNWAPMLKMLKAVVIVWGFLSFIYQSWLQALFSEILSLPLRWVSSHYILRSPTWGPGTLVTHSLVEVFTNSKKVKRNFCSCGWVFSLSCIKYFFSLWKHVIFEGASPLCGYLSR